MRALHSITTHLGNVGKWMSFGPYSSRHYITSERLTPNEPSIHGYYTTTCAGAYADAPDWSASTIVETINEYCRSCIRGGAPQ